MVTSYFDESEGRHVIVTCEVRGGQVWRQCDGTVIDSAKIVDRQFRIDCISTSERRRLEQLFVIQRSEAEDSDFIVALRDLSAEGVE